MGKNILFCGYRDWAIKIYNYIKEAYGSKINIILIKSQDEFLKKIKKLNPGIIFFVGWSWLVDKEIVSKFRCICLHPSPLPKYRGGSPLQHQIINGEKESAVTLFRMNEFVDKGPILWQEKFSLDGDLNEIFIRIIEKGEEGVSTIINKLIKGEPLEGKPQNDKEATYYKRRTPDMSEIKLSDFKDHTANELYNKIRALQDPYPNAFVVCKGGTKLFLQKAKIEEGKK